MYNVIYIHTHDSGRFFSPYGYAMPTPNLMTFAQDSLLFRNAYCAGPTCSPSRSAMLTGMTPHNSGMLGLAHRGFSLACPGQHLSHYLRRNGFCTVLSGVQHEAADVSTLGYDIVLNDDRTVNGKFNNAIEKDTRNAQAAADFIRTYDGKKPLFLSYGMNSTHRVYPDPDGFINPDYVQVPPVIADTPENRRDMAGYMRSVQVADACAGAVLQALKDSGLYENSLVIFTTDHGIAMPFMKCNLYDTGIGVALMMHHPAGTGCGKVTDSLVSQLDVFPTVCDLLGLEKPAYLQGKSLVPLFENPAAAHDEAIYSEVTYHAAYEPMRCIRTERYKLIRRYDYHLRYVPANMDASAPKHDLLEHGLLNNSHDREELFDLRLDPLERRNEVGNPAYAAVYSELSKQLEQHMEATDDPLLHVLHRVPAPENARVNTLDSIEPSENNFE